MSGEGILRAHASMRAIEHKGNVLPWIVYIIVHYLWPNFSLRVKQILGLFGGYDLKSPCLFCVTTVGVFCCGVPFISSDIYCG